MNLPTLMAKKPRNRTFAAVVGRLLGDRSNRDVWKLTGISHTYIGDWRFGSVPTPRKLAEFVDGCRETAEETEPPGIRLSEADVRGLYTAAGYLYVEDDWANNRAPAEDVISHLLDLVDSHPQELTYEPDLENVRAEGIDGRVPAEDVEKANRIFRSIISEMARRQAETARAAASGTGERVTAVETALAQSRRDEDRLLSLRLDGFSAAAIEARLKPLLERRAALEQQAAELQREQAALPHPETAAAVAESWATDARARLETDENPALLQSLYRDLFRVTIWKADSRRTAEFSVRALLLPETVSQNGA